MDLQVLDSDMVAAAEVAAVVAVAMAAAVVESIGGYPIVESTEAVERHAMESHQVNKVSMDVFQSGSIEAPAVRLGYAVRTVVPATLSAIELNPIERHTIVVGQRHERRNIRSIKMRFLREFLETNKSFAFVCTSSTQSSFKLCLI